MTVGEFINHIQNFIRNNCEDIKISSRRCVISSDSYSQLLVDELEIVRLTFNDDNTIDVEIKPYQDHIVWLFTIDRTTNIIEYTDGYQNISELVDVNNCNIIEFLNLAKINWIGSSFKTISKNISVLQNSLNELNEYFEQRRVSNINLNNVIEVYEQFNMEYDKILTEVKPFI